MPGRARANSLVEMPPAWLQSKAVRYQDIFTALADATNDLSMPCHEQLTGAVIDTSTLFITYN